MQNVEIEKTNDLLSRKAVDRIPNGMQWLIALGIFFLLVLFSVIGLILIICVTGEYNHKSNAQYSQEYMDMQIADVKAGRTKCVTFYETSGTDGLLLQLINFPQIEGVVFNLTDVTDDGMKSLASLKKLKWLRLYGADVSDQGFAHLKDACGLEHLELLNTRVTDKGLQLLKKMPNLSFLALEHESRLGVTFTDAGLDNLKSLTKLKKLYLCGGWVPNAAIKRLQEALPDCKISTEDGDLVM